MTRIPVGRSGPVGVGLLAVAALYVVMALDYSEPDGPVTPALGAWCFAGASMALVVALTWVTLPARGSGGHGPTVRGSKPLAAMLAAAVVLGVAGVAAWTATLVSESGPGGVRAGGAFALMLVGALGAIVTIGKVLTGRLRLPRIDVDEHGVRYRGASTDHHLEWDEVSSVALDADQRHVVIRSAATDAPAISIPTAAFDIAARHLVAIVEEARAARTPAAAVVRDRRPRRGSGGFVRRRRG